MRSGRRYKSIEEGKYRIVKVKKIFFDLDGVMADFDRGVHELCGMDAFSHEDDPAYNLDDEM